MLDKVKYEYDKEECEFFLHYEVYSNWLCPYVPQWKWLERLIGTYLKNKALRKYLRFIKHKNLEL